jgi:hypothetical protein
MQRAASVRDRIADLPKPGSYNTDIPATHLR